MKLLIAAEQLRRDVPGGIGTYLRGLVGGLRGVLRPEELTLWASRPPAGGQPDPLKELGAVLTSPLPSRALVWAWDRGFMPPPKGFDVVHAPSLAVPPVRQVPLSVTVHDLAFRRVPETFPRRGRRWHEAALSRALARASLFVTPSRATADDLLAIGAPPDRVAVVEEGCDHLPEPDAHSAREVLRAHGVTGEFLLTVSTLEPRKNLARLVAAYRAARSRFPEPWPLLVVGPDGWGPAVRPERGVVLTGHVSGAILAALYRQARVVISVPLTEGFGLPALEAMACGAPVVASPLPSTGGAAHEVDPLDTEAIAAALVQVATDEGLRDALAAAGRQRAAPLTWERAARRHAELWEALASARPAPPRGR